jgi:hypothetical protein
VLADPELAGRLGHAAREAIGARFDVSRMALDYHRDFLELLAARGRGRGVPVATGTTGGAEG